MMTEGEWWRSIQHGVAARGLTRVDAAVSGVGGGKNRRRRERGARAPLRMRRCALMLLAPRCCSSARSSARWTMASDSVVLVCRLSWTHTSPALWLGVPSSSA